MCSASWFRDRASATGDPHQGTGAAHLEQAEQGGGGPGAVDRRGQRHAGGGEPRIMAKPMLERNTGPIMASGCAMCIDKGQGDGG